MQVPDESIWAELMHAIEADDRRAIQAMAAAGSPSFEQALGAWAPGDAEMRTPLMLAYWFGKASAAAALVNAGADYQQEDSSGRNAAWYARHFGNGERVRRMGDSIQAETRRLSMRSLIECGQADTATRALGDGGSPSVASSSPAPKRRRNDI